MSYGTKPGATPTNKSMALMDAKPGMAMEDMPTEEEVAAAGGMEEAMAIKQKSIRQQQYAASVAALNARGQELYNRHMDIFEFAKKAVVKQQV
tara:strand:- start:102 stop:380 length:279 start_codon:yes stop_codon:yes gene_type:complete